MEQKSTIAIIETTPDLSVLLNQHQILEHVSFTSVKNYKEGISKGCQVIIDDLSDDECILHILKNDSQVSLKKPIMIRWITEKLSFILLQEKKDIIQIGKWQLNCKDNQLFVNGDEIHLTEKEGALLAYFMRLHPKSVTKEELQEHVWGYADGVDSQTLQSHLYRLRQKLGDAGSCIKLGESGYYLSL